MRKWHRTYAAIGLEGLLSMGGSCRSYSWEVKVAAAKAVVDGAEPKADVMGSLRHSLALPAGEMVQGVPRGRAGRAQAQAQGEAEGLEAAGGGTSREQELERRVRKLEAENAYLKIDRPEGGALSNREKAAAVAAFRAIPTF